MKRTTAAPKLLAAVIAVAILTVPAAFAQQAPAKDITPIFLSQGVVIDGLRAVDIGGILVLRGRTADRAQAEAAGKAAQTMGYTRVANLVQITEPVDDALIERRAERELGMHRTFDGCNIRINSQGGVVRISGTVQHELQKDFALQIVRSVDGVKAVRSDLQRF